MEKLFVPYDLSVKIKEKGFKCETLAKYSDFLYPLNDSGDDFARCKCLYIPFENRFDEIRMLWIEKENGHFHWHEGTYTEGEHSRCELTGEDTNAPTYDQFFAWLRNEHNIIACILPQETKDMQLLYQFSIYKLETEGVYGCGIVKLAYDFTSYDEALINITSEALNLI